MTGVCRYCGQTCSAPDYFETASEADAYATRHCCCDESAEERGRTDRIIDAQVRLARLLGDNSARDGFMPIESPDIMDLFDSIVEEIGSGRVRAATVWLTGNSTIDIGVTAKGSIRVQRRETRSLTV